MFNFKIYGAGKVAMNLSRASKTLVIENYKKMDKAMWYLANYIQREELSGQLLRRRSGRLANSIRPKTLISPQGVTGIVGSKVIYARIHELGGEIKPKNVRYLTIPMRDAMTPAGVLRKPARRWRNTFVLNKNGKKFIVQKAGKKKIKFLFLLWDKPVRIKAKHYLQKALDKNKQKIIDMTWEGVKMAVRVGNGQ